MTKPKSNPHSRLKFLVILPLIGAMVLSLSNATGYSLSSGELLPASPVSDLATAIEIPLTDGNSNSGTIPQKDTLFTVVEELPTFVGGQEALIDYIVKNITYPPDARSKGIQGTVYVSFTVAKTGKVMDAKILRGIGGGCDEEALRIVTGMPDWNPGKDKGKPVNVIFNLPIRFTLSNDTNKDTETDVGADKDKDK
jgi:TonB family protein